MSVGRMERVLRRAGAAREAAMLDECVVSRPSTSAPIIDTATGAMTPAAAVEVYAGRCTLFVSNAAGQPARDDTALTETRTVLRVPMGTGPFRIGDVVTLSVVWDGFAERVTGRSWRVIGVPERSARIDQRLELAEVLDEG